MKKKIGEMVEDEVGVVIHGNIYVLWQPLYVSDQPSWMRKTLQEIG